MKKSIRKNLIILCAVSAVVIANAVSVFAAPTVRPMPGTSRSNTVTSSGTSASNETGTSSGTTGTSSGTTGTSSGTTGTSSGTTGAGNYKASDNDEGTSSVTRTAPTPVAVSGSDRVNIVSDTETATKEKGSVSIGGMILWLIISVIINAAISFWIGNRFYLMTKKNTHVTSEIRALRHDIEEKFLQNVGGFSEQETDIANANADYSMSDDGLKMQRRQREERLSDEEEYERFKQWEKSQSDTTPRSPRRQPSSHSESRYESNIRKKYQPTREEIEPEIEDYDIEDIEEMNSPKSGLKKKAKGFLGEIFPFMED